MQCNTINCSPSDSLRRLHQTLDRKICFPEKQNASSSSLHEMQTASCLPSQPEFEWSSPVSQTLKERIADCFRSEILAQNLQSSICSTSALAEHCVTVPKSELNLSCLQHPEKCLSGNAPDVGHFSNENLHAASLAEGLLLDRRGIHDERLSLCKECQSYIWKGKTPPLSLTNHLLLGDVPAELQNLTPVKESMIAWCHAKACIIHLKADDNGVVLPNTQQGMCCHIVIYPQKPGNLLNILPPSMENVCTPICVVFIGSQMTKWWMAVSPC